MKKKAVDQYPKSIIIISRILAAVPVLISVVWLIYVIATKKSVALGQAGLMLAPMRETTPLIAGLVIFTVGYIMFLHIVFGEQIKRWIVKNMHR